MGGPCATSGRGAKVGKKGALRMKSLDVLMPVEGMGLIGDLIGARLPLHRLWLEPNPDLWLAEWGPRIRAIAVAGHIRADEAYMRRFPSLEIVSSFGVGYDHIDAKAAARLGIIVTNTPGVLDDEVADTALGLILMAVRQLPQAERYLRAGLWAKGAYPLTASLRDRTGGIIGPGRLSFSFLSFAGQQGQGRGLSHRRRPGRPRAPPYRQRRSARGAGAGRGA